MQRTRSEPRMLSATAIGRIFVLQVAANILVLSFIIMQLILAAARLERIQETQIQVVQDQNTLSLCNQREMIVAVRSIGRKLGLPVADITAPNVDPVECERLADAAHELHPTEENP